MARTARNEAKRPQRVGAIHRRSFLSSSAALACSALVAPAVSGCGGPRDERTLGPFVVAMKADTPAVLESEEASIFQVTRSIPLPLRARATGLPRTAPYPGSVQTTSEQLRVQLVYVITNLEDRPLTLSLLVDGWNEFHYYLPQVRIVDDEVVEDRSPVHRLMIVPAKARVSGTVSYDDFERMAMALAAIEGGVPNPFHALEPSTKLREDPLTARFVPAVISGISGFDLSLRMREAARVAVEATVEVLDLAERLVPTGELSPNAQRESGRRQFEIVLPEAE